RQRPADVSQAGPHLRADRADGHGTAHRQAVAPAAKPQHREDVVIRVVFLGTPEFAVPSLKTLIEEDDFEVVGVVTQPDRPAGRGQQVRKPPVKEVAETHGIPVCQPGRLRTDAAALAQLREWAPDVMVVVAFGQILPREVLELAPHGCINVHASLLPRWRGAAPIHYAIRAGDAETGVSIMR